MGNHNVLITNPKGERVHQFRDNVSLDQCKEWIEEFGPAPIGWHYQIINLNKKPRKYPDYILLKGYDAEGELKDIRKVGVKHNRGWYTPKKGKRDGRRQGAIWFSREKVWGEKADGH